MTKNDWFTTNLSERTRSNLCDLKLGLQPYEFEDQRFLDVARKTARDLCDTFDNLHLCYSGGSDSEFVLQTFSLTGLPITPVLIDTPFNQYEMGFAYEQCTRYGAKPMVLSYTKNEIIDKLKERSLDRGLFSLLGGLPLVACDAVNQVGGKLLTGYGDPFSIISGLNPTHPLSTTLEFSEWDYYLDSYDSSHPSGFFTYDIALFHALISQIEYGAPVQQAKCDLYDVPYRMKMYWKEEFYQIFRDIRLEFSGFSVSAAQGHMLENLNKYGIKEKLWLK